MSLDVINNELLFLLPRILFHFGQFIYLNFALIVFFLQDLCRQRMATKQTEKPEPLSRISSIAQSEGAQPSPSSRSSTSSWSEEPVQSNMDISTGHVVLVREKLPS